jgi:hypothetical protein
MLKKAWLVQRPENDCDLSACELADQGVDEKFASAARERIDVALMMDTAENE